MAIVYMYNKPKLVVFYPSDKWWFRIFQDHVLFYVYNMKETEKIEELL